LTLTIAGEYIADIYSSLPLLDEARDAFTDQNFDQHMVTGIRDLLLKHNVQDRMKFFLLRRHCKVEEVELLIHLGNVALPWKRGASKKELLERTMPSQWRRDTNIRQVVPFGFAYDDKDFGVAEPFDLAETPTLPC
jgi:hypothetical protein